MLPRGVVANPSSKRKDLQGIRELAILGVLGFHFYPKLFPNGYLGVDQFFVLSGFFMCMLLTRSQKFPIFAIFVEFYTRRFKRILPLYFFFILLTMCVIYSGFPDAAILLNQESAGKALMFVSNRPETVEENYFKKVRRNI
ncbi:CBN-OAC-48 protein [Caenorhabditis brenneri]|uniref:CBN-OAC-48 protein n=1 Tax=Caenorhabditis brenneri TaxID=135651 RepID=G0PB09_CAEBE|nr:CBN-OAC-48 protein [Caenorhabditis brenneri]